MTASEPLEIRVSSNGGVPFVHVPRPGNTLIGLVFAVGRADETLATGGITHLVEHLALASTARLPYFHNGQVDMRFTRFFAEMSDPGDAAGFIRLVCSGLAGVGDDRSSLDHERRILLTEGGRRRPSPAEVCLAERFGARGPGLAAYEEFGLRSLGPPEVAAWRDRWFTAGNAVLWVIGTVPTKLEITLPSGERSPFALPPERELDLPAYLVAAGNVVGVSFVDRNSVEFRVALDILGDRATQRLRGELGLSYEVGAGDARLAPDVVHGFASADALPENIGGAAQALLSVIEQVATDGPTQGEIEAAADRLGERLRSAAALPVLVDARATMLLEGRSDFDLDSFLAERRAARPIEVRDALARAFAQSITVAPRAAPAMRARFVPVPGWSTDRIEGRELRRVGQPEQPYPSLVLGSDGATYFEQESRFVTARYASCAAALEWSDGKVTLIGEDGLSFVLDPAEWPDEKEVRGEALSRIDPKVRIPIDKPGPTRKPPVSPEGTAAKPTVARQWDLLRVGPIALGVVSMFFVATGVAKLGGLTGTDHWAGVALVLLGILGLVGYRFLLLGRLRRRHHTPVTMQGERQGDDPG